MKKSRQRSNTHVDTAKQAHDRAVAAADKQYKATVANARETHKATHECLNSLEAIYPGKNYEEERLRANRSLVSTISSARRSQRTTRMKLVYALHPVIVESK